MDPRRHIRMRAYAKINLSLRVKDARPDGYHDLETVFQSLALHDTLDCRLGRGPLTLDGRNLVWRAARHLWRALGHGGEPHGVAMTLTKQVPMQAGLGGGSADAAAALVALSALWGGGRPVVDLAEVAARVGADVSYFLMGGTALGLARGEHLYPLPDLPPCHVVLALPGFGVSTAEAYGWLDADRAGAGRRRARVAARSAFSLRGWPARTLIVSNDLEAPVARRHPEIARLRDLLASSGAMAAAMTGSGSAVFGLFESPVTARRAARAVAQSGAVSMLTCTLDRRAYLKALAAPARGF